VKIGLDREIEPWPFDQFLPQIVHNIIIFKPTPLIKKNYNKMILLLKCAK
jgi:hypothetical protein